MKYLTGNQIRQLWLDFFKIKGHEIIPSASLIPNNDPTLLWINSGVAPLKKYFDGAPILYYINYINMRTMVNAVGKSDLNNKSQYLKVIFNDEEIHDRLKKVDKKYLDLSNRILLDMMLKIQTKFLLVISYIYRKVK